MKIKIGDRVGYSAQWLRSTGQYTGTVPFARGEVVKIREYTSSLVLATIAWEEDNGLHTEVHVANLTVFRAKQRK